ncbi:hypothetical protein AUEXF2481DRAFT_438652 [Aureobasidium subglaciale EXF-2481]|uniref:Uncharacterized protein n=1 Tax=Aureobasidium subglaciale (strain EXF-2481) TaxID=1043005 RepID=A0A074Y3E9_AURSE|nr:uncharacterized protein AUEXF2481DRAFT_438652 [Aureobasidium subglaciale EXF-2481]KEQ92230.1 hypothetical protein AUEXF2481DRAFT_438652 [Aureobasidium subglaciale EXF-2481]
MLGGLLAVDFRLCCVFNFILGRYSTLHASSATYCVYRCFINRSAGRCWASPPRLLGAVVKVPRFPCLISTDALLSLVPVECRKVGRPARGRNAHATMLAALEEQKPTLGHSGRSDVKQERKKNSSATSVYEMTSRYNAARAAVSARTNNQELGGYHKQADDKGRKAGEGALAAGSRPDLRQSQVDFVRVPKKCLYVIHCRSTFACDVTG